MCFSLTHVSESPFRKWGLSVPHSSPTVATCPFWVMLTKHWLSSPRSPVHGLFQSFHGSGTSSLLLLDCWCLTALMNGESRSSISGFIWSAVTAGQCVYLLSRTGVCNNTLYLVLLRLWLFKMEYILCETAHCMLHMLCMFKASCSHAFWLLILTFANPVKRVKDVKIMADITDEKKSGLLADFRWILCNYQLVKMGD